MYADEMQTDSDALRDLARRIVRDHVTSDYLDEYVTELLDLHLVELPAICRSAAKLFRDCQLRLTPSCTAALLNRRADRLDHHH